MSTRIRFLCAAVALLLALVVACGCLYRPARPSSSIADVLDIAKSQGWHVEKSHVGSKWWITSRKTCGLDKLIASPAEMQGPNWQGVVFIVEADPSSPYVHNEEDCCCLDYGFCRLRGDPEFLILLSKHLRN